MTHFNTENHSADSFLLMIDHEWRLYFSESVNATVFSQRRRALAKLTPLEIVYCLLYAILFLAGLAANIWAFRVVGTVLRRCGGRHVNILTYIGALALINVLILIFLPITITDIIAGEWLFPNFLCPIYWVVETLNKTVSPLILACLTVSCYCSVCQPRMVRMYRCPWVACAHILFVSMIVAWKAKPFVDYSSSFHLINFVNDSASVNYGKKCLFHPPDKSDVIENITWDGFLSIYLLPMIYMIAFYGAILRAIMAQSRSLGRRSPPRHFWRAARSAAALIGFYFCCWTPYWCVTLAMVLTEGRPTDYGLWSVVAFAAHVLPMVNCAFAPLLYTLSNSHLRTLYNTTVAAKEQRKKLRHKSSGYVESN